MPEQARTCEDPASADCREQTTALVRAIRRAYQSPSGYGGVGVEAFHVANVHEFARRVVEQGVRAPEDGP